MYEVFSGLPPYHDVSHDKSLTINQGFGPRFNIKVPNQSNPLDRPTADEIMDNILSWEDCVKSKELTELKKQIKEAEEINNKLLTNNVIPLTSLALSYETHSEAIYTSRLLNFNNLPQSKILMIIINNMTIL